MPVLTKQAGMAAGHVSFRQADGVAFLTADRDLFTDEGNNGLAPLVVFDDELQHGSDPLTAIAERPKPLQGMHPPKMTGLFSTCGGNRAPLSIGQVDERPAPPGGDRKWGLEERTA
jgi:hypothetical protein